MDDILAIAVLSVVTTMVQTGNMTPNIFDIIFLILKILGIFVALLVGAVFIIPRILHAERLWKSRGSIEGIVTASFFGASGIAAIVGLSPIVGAFAVGMAVASTKIIGRVEEYVEKLEIIFAPLFFAIIGAQVNLTGVNLYVLFLTSIVVGVAIVTKLVGCGLPSMIFLKDRFKSNESRYWYDFKRRSWTYRSRNRSNEWSIVIQYLYNGNHNGGSYYYDYSHLVKESIP